MIIKFSQLSYELSLIVAYSRRNHPIHNLADPHYCYTWHRTFGTFTKLRLKSVYTHPYTDK